MTRQLPPDDLSPSSTEAAVADVFGEVLQLPEIPSDVSFFYLGGMSLDAIRACALLSDRLGVAIGLSTFLENQTVRELGLAIALGLSRDAFVPAVNVAGPANRVPLTAIQTEILLQELMGGKHTSAHCIMSWRIKGSVDPSALEKAVQDVHRRHEALRACYRFDDVPHASVPDGPASAEWEALATSAARADSVLAERLRAPFDPRLGRVWRAVLVQAGDFWLLGISVHHIASDGYAQNLIAADLQVAYAARLAGHEPEFGWRAPTLQDVAAEYAQQISSADLGRQREYWRGELRGLPDLPERFGYRGQDDEASVLGIGSESAVVHTAFPDDIFDSLSSAARRNGTTTFVVLLGCYFEAFHRVSGVADFAVGTPIARRTGSATSRAVGCMTGMTCFRSRSRSEAACDDYFRVCRDQVQAAMGSLDVSLPELARLLRPPRSDRGVFFQTVFALQDMAAPRCSLPDAVTELRLLSASQPPADLVAQVYPPGTADSDAMLRLHFGTRAVSPRFAQELATEFSAVAGRLG